MTPPPSTHPRPTMADVGRAAGVSQSTVSFVLNDRRDIVIAAMTRERVLAAADALGYRVNRRARELRLQRSTTIGVVSHGVASHPFAGQMLAGLQAAARESGHICMIVDLDAADGADEIVENLVDRDVAGLVHASAATHAVADSGRFEDVRTVYAGCWPKHGSVGEGRILPDDIGGGRAAAAHLFELGHRDVVFLGGVRDAPATHDRERGFEEAAAAFGFPAGALPRLYGGYDIDSGFRLVRSLFAERRPTGLVCGNDRMALGALLALHELGLRVPADVSLVGYDDQEEFAAFLHPRLTTVRLPHFEIGHRAGSVIVGAPIAAPLEEAIACELVVRDSTARPGASAGRA